jgi:hypothetical protein
MKQEPTLRVKSTPLNYYKELNGIKSNTVRFTDDWEESRWKKYNEAKYVSIGNKENPKERFKRLICDKTAYKNIVVISWKE